MDREASTEAYDQPRRLGEDLEAMRTAGLGLTRNS